MTASVHIGAGTYSRNYPVGSVARKSVNNK
jgi:hypothetical protein